MILKKIFIFHPKIGIFTPQMHFFCIFLRKNLVISKKCSTFAPAFEKGNFSSDDPSEDKMRNELIEGFQKVALFGKRHGCPDETGKPYLGKRLVCQHIKQNSDEVR